MSWSHDGGSRTPASPCSVIERAWKVQQSSRVVGLRPRFGCRNGGFWSNCFCRHQRGLVISKIVVFCCLHDFTTCTGVNWPKCGLEVVVLEECLWTSIMFRIGWRDGDMNRVENCKNKWIAQQNTKKKKRKEIVQITSIANYLYTSADGSIHRYRQYSTDCNQFLHSFVDIRKRPDSGIYSLPR